MSLPKDEETEYSCEDGLGAVRRAIEAFYQIERKDIKRYVWDGPEIKISRILSCCLTLKESFSKNNLNYEEEDQGIDPLDVCLRAAYQLGFQAGWLDRNFEVDILSSSNDLLQNLLKSRRNKAEGSK